MPKFTAAKDKPPPMVGPPISSGFPSPAEDYEEPPLDLHNLVVSNPLATYFMEMDSDEHAALGVQRGDILMRTGNLRALAHLAEEFENEDIYLGETTVQ